MSAITPELALIDPALAAAARASLPDPGQFRPAPVGRKQTTLVAEAAGEPLRRRDRTPSTLMGRGLLVAAISVVAVSAVAFGALALSARPWAAEPVQTARLAAPARLPLHVRAMRQAQAASTYTWPAVPGAESYEVKFMRGRQPVYEATTRVPAVELPATLLLSPGRYTWSVTPRSSSATAGRSARPVVEGAFEVTAS